MSSDQDLQTTQHPLWVSGRLSYYVQKSGNRF